MESSRVIIVSIFVVIVLGGGYLYGPAILAPPADSYERTTVTVYDDNATMLAAVDVRIADTPRTRYVGLSETDSLGANEGMLFVHETEDEYTYVMRRMAFPIDIVFIDSEGTITTIHHASTDTAGDRNEYRGTGKYVLEVPHHYTTERGIEVGNRVDVANTTAS